MSTKGSSAVPNNWSIQGEVDLNEQAEWYKAMFEASLKRKWVFGFAMWDWAWKQYSLSSVETNKGYDVYGKTAEKIIKTYYDIILED